MVALKPVLTTIGAIAAGATVPAWCSIFAVMVILGTAGCVTDAASATAALPGAALLAPAALSAGFAGGPNVAVAAPEAVGALVGFAEGVADVIGFGDGAGASCQSSLVSELLIAAAAIAKGACTTTATVAGILVRGTPTEIAAAIGAGMAAANVSTAAAIACSVMIPSDVLVALTSVVAVSALSCLAGFGKFAESVRVSAGSGWTALVSGSSAAFALDAERGAVASRGGRPSAERSSAGRRGA